MDSLIKYGQVNWNILSLFEIDVMGEQNKIYILHSVGLEYVQQNHHEISHKSLGKYCKRRKAM